MSEHLRRQWREAREFDPASRALDDKIRGWEWVVSEFRRVREEARAEAERLLGPDRGGA